MEIKKNSFGVIAVQIIYLLSAICIVGGIYLYFDSSSYRSTSLQGILCLASGIGGLIFGVVVSLLVDIEYNQRVQIHLMPEPPKDNGKI